MVWLMKQIETHRKSLASVVRVISHDANKVPLFTKVVCTCIFDVVGSCFKPEYY